MASNRRKSIVRNPYAEPLQQAMSPGPTVSVMVSGSPEMRKLLDGIMPIKEVWQLISDKAKEGSAWALSAWVQYYHGKPHERVDMHNDMAALMAAQMAVLVALQGGGRLPDAAPQLCPGQVLDLPSPRPDGEPEDDDT